MKRLNAPLLLGLLVVLWYLVATAMYLPQARRDALSFGDLDHVYRPPSVGFLAELTDLRTPEIRAAMNAQRDGAVDATSADDPFGLPSVFDEGADDPFAPIPDPDGTDSDETDPLETALGTDRGPSVAENASGYWLFGTDALGRSLATLVAGAPAFYLPWMLLYVAISLLLMLVVGVSAGYAPRSIPGRGATLLVEANHALPQLVVIFAVLAVAEIEMGWLVVALSIVSGIAKSILIRDKIRSVLVSDFVEGLREMGIPARVVVGRHLLRTHCRALLLVQVPFLIAELVLFEACLGYLEHPVDIEGLSYGSMLATAVDTLGEGLHWLFLFPALGIVASIWGFYALGTGLAQVFNERNPYSL
jgi:peptide/nickel transport system permease protein